MTNEIKKDDGASEHPPAGSWAEAAWAYQRHQEATQPKPATPPYGFTTEQASRFNLLENLKTARENLQQKLEAEAPDISRLDDTTPLTGTPYTLLTFPDTDTMDHWVSNAAPNIRVWKTGKSSYNISVWCIVSYNNTSAGKLPSVPDPEKDLRNSGRDQPENPSNSQSGGATDNDFP